jgi:predicted DNA-binding WGR domain protein
VKAVLEFNLPEDKDDFELAHQSARFWSALWEFKELVRSWNKHGHGAKSVAELLDVVTRAWEEATEDIHWEDVS